MRQLIAVAAAILLLAADRPTASLELAIERARSARGYLHICLTRNPRYFPDCSKDALAVKRTVPAATRILRLNELAPGRYAVALIHDENRNGKLDMPFGIPREGFGFSRNPKVRFGAPRYSQVDIELPAGLARHTVRLQYIL
jgi:uncharacterized protein (DUF2141 family)